MNANTKTNASEGYGGKILSKSALEKRNRYTIIGARVDNHSNIRYNFISN